MIARPAQEVTGLSVAQTTLILLEDPADTYNAAFERRGHTEFPSPEHALLFAVLMDTLHLLQSTPLNRRHQPPFQEALAWFYSSRAQTPFDFEVICQAFNFDPDCLRQGVQAILDAIARGEASHRLRSRRASLYIGSRHAQLADDL